MVVRCDESEQVRVVERIDLDRERVGIAGADLELRACHRRDARRHAACRSSGKRGDALRLDGPTQEPDDAPGELPPRAARGIERARHPRDPPRHRSARAREYRRDLVMRTAPMAHRDRMSDDGRLIVAPRHEPARQRHPAMPAPGATQPRAPDLRLELRPTREHHRRGADPPPVPPHAITTAGRAASAPTAPPAFHATRASTGGRHRRSACPSGTRNWCSRAAGPRSAFVDHVHALRAGSLPPFGQVPSRRPALRAGSLPCTAPTSCADASRCCAAHRRPDPIPGARAPIDAGRATCPPALVRRTSTQKERRDDLAERGNTHGLEHRQPADARSRAGRRDDHHREARPIPRPCTRPPARSSSAGTGRAIDFWDRTRWNQIGFREQGGTTSSSVFPRAFNSAVPENHPFN